MSVPLGGLSADALELSTPVDSPTFSGRLCSAMVEEVGYCHLRMSRLEDNLKDWSKMGASRRNHENCPRCRTYYLLDILAVHVVHLNQTSKLKIRHMASTEVHRLYAILRPRMCPR